MSKTKQHTLEKKIDLAACELLEACHEYNNMVSGNALASYVEVFGLAVLALEGVNSNNRRKRLVKRARVICERLPI